MMAMNPLLKQLVEVSAAKYAPDSNLKHKVWRQVHGHANKVTEERRNWFNRRCMPPTSVLSRLPHYDRDAMIAHYRAKEMREVADAMNDGNHYKAGLARKRLERVNNVAKAFAEV